MEEEHEKIIYNTWIKCDDCNYWQTDYDLVAYDIDGEMTIMSRNECMFGWSNLCRFNAQIFTAEPPKNI